MKYLTNLCIIMVLKNSLIMKAAAHLLLLLSFLLFPLTAEAQNQDSVQGDFEALMALYNSTQGNGLPVLSNTSQLPSTSNAPYPFMYKINGDIHVAELDEKNTFRSEWVNIGTPWTDKTGWENMTPETMGDAVGVTVNGEGRVTRIDMQKVTTQIISGRHLPTGNKLVGTLPPEIGNLTKLKYINIKQNYFYGEIPDVFGSMQNLERFSLAGQTEEFQWAYNRRTSWHELAHVRGFDDPNDPYTGSWGSVNVGKNIVVSNRFKSELPRSLGNLPKLELIEIRKQYLLGSLPEEWGNITTLKGLALSAPRRYNSPLLQMSIPASWGSFTEMIFFKLEGHYQGDTWLIGGLPTGLENWSNLANIAVYSAGLSGFAPEFTSARDVRYYNISRNNFSGEFPWASIFNGDNSRISKLSISRNNFSGELPETIPPATYPSNNPNYNLAAVSITQNSFSGQLPAWLGLFPDLQIINVSRNNFSGDLHDILPPLAEKPRLRAIRAEHNNIGGTLPEVEFKSDVLRVLQFHENNIEGEIPDSWISFFFLDGEWKSGVNFSSFNFSHNKMSGRIPDWGLNVSWSSFQSYTFEENNHSFADIVPVYQDLKNFFGNDFTVNNQNPFGTAETMSVSDGGELMIDLSDFDTDGNQYQWLRDGSPISGETSPILVIPNADSSHAGEYQLEVTNSGIPELGTQISEPITVEISGI